MGVLAHHDPRRVKRETVGEYTHRTGAVLHCHNTVTTLSPHCYQTVTRVSQLLGPREPRAMLIILLKPLLRSRHRAVVRMGGAVLERRAWSAAAVREGAAGDDSRHERQSILINAVEEESASIRSAIFSQSFAAKSLRPGDLRYSTGKVRACAAAMAGEASGWKTVHGKLPGYRVSHPVSGGKMFSRL